jgi:hypothetical protein
MCLLLEPQESFSNFRQEYKDQSLWSVVHVCLVRQQSEAYFFHRTTLHITINNIMDVYIVHNIMYHSPPPPPPRIE